MPSHNAVHRLAHWAIAPDESIDSYAEIDSCRCRNPRNWLRQFFYDTLIEEVIAEEHGWSPLIAVLRVIDGCNAATFELARLQPLYERREDFRCVCDYEEGSRARDGALLTRHVGRDVLVCLRVRSRPHLETGIVKHNESVARSEHVLPCSLSLPVKRIEKSTHQTTEYSASVRQERHAKPPTWVRSSSYTFFPGSNVARVQVL